MANKTLSYGSSGDEVKKLQKALNNAGYSLDVDGEFGRKTQNAVKAYQQKNGLSVDGIVGVNTWNSLSKGNVKAESNAKSTSKVNNTTQTVIKAPAVKKRPEYQKSENVASAEKNIADWENNKPAEYNSKYSKEIESILNDILNREKFKYNINADPLYNQYKEQYINNGKKAMMDTIANASALTGGYSNSYAVTAGNQSYNDYLDNLNNIALDLYDRAYAAYTDDEDSAINKLSVLREADKDDYNKYRDDINDYYTNGEYLLNKLSALSDSEYSAFLEQIEAYENDREYEYQKYIDALEQQQLLDELALAEQKYKDELAFKKSEAERDQKNKDRAYALSKAKARASSSSSSKKSSSTNEYKTASIMPKTYQQFVYLTGQSGIFTESEFNSNKSAKKEYGNYENYIKEMYYKYGSK